MRVGVLNTFNSDFRTVDFDGNTWGQLKRQLGSMFTEGNTAARVRETKVTLESDDAVLPIGLGRDTNGQPNGTDCTIFLTQQKVKSGDGNQVDLEEFTNVLREEFDNAFDNVLSRVFGDGYTKVNIEVEKLSQEAEKLNNSIKG